MRILMLGWEFPPFVSGGLGTACYGLTKALAARGAEITFVLPKVTGQDYHEHVRLLAPQAPEAAKGERSPDAVASTYRVDTTSPAPVQQPPPPQVQPDAHPAPHDPGLENVTFRAVPSRIASPYRPALPEPDRTGRIARGVPSRPPVPSGTPTPAPAQEQISFFANAEGGDDYGGDLLSETRRYADLVLDLAEGVEFDAVHAHDWLTFPAAQAVAARHGKPMVAHVHSTEYDRSGDQPHHALVEIERAGVAAADRVIAVSHLTRRMLETRYGCDPAKIRVVYNGLENGTIESRINAPNPKPIRKTDKIVLFLGRITMQKGPEYFVAAAKRVLECVSDVKFVMAGSGDQVRRVIELAAEYGIGDRVLFTGFLRGEDVARVFQMADVYVMPSVSEPFGIAPLEAISHDVPVIISKTSGVSEVLEHVLKVDFWDIDEMANKIAAVLKYPPLGVTMRSHADLEASRLTWDSAAERCDAVYDELTGAAPETPAKVDPTATAGSQDAGGPAVAPSVN
ncbi:MAG: glycosyltransferase [Planctomycetota bacterium]